MAMKIKGSAGNSGKNSDKKAAVPESLKPFCFQPGESGNPSGRPKKKPISDAYAAILNNPADAKKLAQAQFDKACAGDTSAAKEIADRVEGKVMQGIRMEGELGLTTEEERKARVMNMLREGAQRIEKVQ